MISAFELLKRVKKSTTTWADQMREMSPQDYIDAYGMPLAEAKWLKNEVMMHFYGVNYDQD